MTSGDNERIAPSIRKAGQPTNRAQAQLARAVRAAMALTPAVMLGMSLTPAQVLAQGSETSPATGRQSEGTESARSFAIAAQPLASALDRFSEQTGISFAYTTSQLEGLRSPGVTGEMTARQALARLLAGTGVTFEFTSAETVTLANAGAQADGGPIRTGPITVEGAAGPRLGTADYERDEGFKADYQVSATKTPLLIRETPQSISVITRDSMDARQVRDLGSALELASGVSVVGRVPGPFAGTSAIGGEELVVRGQNLNAGFGILTDGVATGDIEVPTDLALFERVEVVKGPSSTLYGPASLSGFVNRVTKKPRAERTARLGFQAGSYDTYRAEMDLTGALDSEERFLGGLVFAWEDSGSFADGVEQRTLLVAPSIDVRIAERTRLLLQAHYQDRQGTPNNGFALVPENADRLRAPAVPRSFFFGNPEFASFDSQQGRLAATLDHQIGDQWLASLVLQRGYARADSENGVYGFGIYEGANTYVYSSARDAGNDYWAGDLRLSGQFTAFGQEHDLLIGVEARRSEFDNRTPYAYAGFGNIYDGFDSFTPAELPDPPNFGRDSSIQTNGAYAQVVLRATERTRVIAGLRYDSAENRTQLLDSPKTGGTVEELTYRIALSQDLWAGLTGFVSFATAFVPVTALGADGGVLDPEEGRGWEIGLKGEWLDGSLGATLSAYHQERDKVPLALTREECQAGGAGLTSCSRSAGLQENRGIELEVVGGPSDGLQLSLAATVADGEFIEEADPNFGEKTAGLVDWQVGLHLDYRVQSGLFQGVGVGGTLFAVGDRRGFAVRRKADGHERADFYVRYNIDPSWTISAQIYNAFDKRFISQLRTTSNGNFFGASRAALLGVEYQFDP